MTTNRFVNNPDTPDLGFQNEFDRLVIESIQFYGHNVQYLPRTLINEDYLFGEDTISEFKESIEIEVYIESVEGYEGDREFIAQYGLELRDQITLVMSQTRWHEESGKDEDPKEGDLIYIPMTKSLFEISFVDRDAEFYQQGKNYIYKLTCEKFEYSHEQFDTGVSEVDDLNQIFENADDSSNNPFADNIDIQTESDAIKTFTEEDPFGSF